MGGWRILLLAGLLVGAVAVPARGQSQFEILDHAQDGLSPQPVQEATAPAAPPICGTRPLSIARMSWTSAALLAEIHALLLRDQFGCSVQVVPGDLATTGASMGANGQPAIAPEMWVTRLAEVWNGALKAQMVRPAGPSYDQQGFENWYVPDYLARLVPQLSAAATLKAGLERLAGDQKIPLISCPSDWGCAIINDNLVRALEIEDLVEIVTPANRFAMDGLIAEAVSKKEPFLLYYWQPNAILAQFGFTPIALPPYGEAAFKCLGQKACGQPDASGFAPENVQIAVAEWVFAEAPQIAGYLGRAQMPLREMDTLLMQVNVAGGDVSAVAARFVAERQDIWGQWTGASDGAGQ